MEVRRQRQLNAVGDEVLAITAVVGPILMGLLSALKQDVVKEAGGHQNVKLKMLPRLYRPGDGDVGVCFEYAVHEAMNNGDSQVLDRIATAARLCRINTVGLKSILFGLEKTGAVQLIDTAHNILTDDSRAMTGSAGQPPKLRRRLTLLSAAFKKPTTRLALPYSIRGLWKADLFIGSTNTQQWVGTSIKINATQLEGAAGLRIGIVPTRQGRSDAVRLDSAKNMVICPLHHDADFMQVFYEAWRIVQAFINADALVPKEVLLPRPVDREICRMLAERREFPTVDVVEAMRVFGQPELLATESEKVVAESVAAEPALTATLVAPVSRNVW